MTISFFAAQATPALIPATATTTKHAERIFMVFSFGVEKAADDKKLRASVKERRVGRRGFVGCRRRDRRRSERRALRGSARAEAREVQGGRVRGV
ncbi:MAG TPA: hypothetical protein VIQ54_11150, partial [Polyangia bacterium]